MIISLIVAIPNNMVIGKDGELPWRIGADLKRFKTITTNHVVVMGRKTHESIGRALPNRINIVVSFNPKYEPFGGYSVQSIADAVRLARSFGAEEVFFIGGEAIYRQILPAAQILYITRIDAEFEGDVYFPEIDWEEWELFDKEILEKGPDTPYNLQFQKWRRKKP